MDGMWFPRRKIMPLKDPTKPRKIPCPECDATGIVDNQPCPDCNGAKFLEATIVQQ